MEGAGIDLQLGGDAGTKEAPRVLEILVEEEIERSGLQESRRSPRESAACAGASAGGRSWQLAGGRSCAAAHRDL
jgi:hypothetical protein